MSDQRFCTTGGLGMPAEIADRVNCMRHTSKGAWLECMGKSLYPLIAAGYCVDSPPMYDLAIEWQNLGNQRWKGVRLKAPASELKIIRTQRARIRLNRDACFYGDGEILCKASRFDLSIDRARLRLLS